MQEVIGSSPIFSTKECNSGNLLGLPEFVFSQNRSTGRYGPYEIPFLSSVSPLFGYNGPHCSVKGGMTSAQQYAFQVSDAYII